MPKKRSLPINFPLGGLNERMAFEEQPPLTTPDCENVRPEASIASRARGGNRPGYWLAYAEKLTKTVADPNGITNSPVRMINSVRTIEQPNLPVVYQFPFDVPMQTGPWVAPNWPGSPPIDSFILVSPSVPGVGFDLGDLTPPQIERGAVLDGDEFDYDESLSYSLSIDVIPGTGSLIAGRWGLAARLSALAPNPFEDGVIAQISALPNDREALTFQLDVYVGGVKTALGLTTIDDPLAGEITGGLETYMAPSPGFLKMIIIGSAVKVYWRDLLVFDTTVPEPQHSNLAGFKRIALLLGSLLYDYEDPGTGEDVLAITKCDNFRFVYLPLAEENPNKDQTLLVASARGNLWMSDPEDTSSMKQVTVSDNGTDLTIADDRLIHSAERTTKLYIADWGDEKVNDSGSATINDTIITTSEDLDVGIVTRDYVVVITASIPDVGDVDDYNGVFEITAVNPGTGQIAISPGVGGTGTGIAFRVERGPKVYDPITEELSLWLADQTLPDVSRPTNQVPVGCPLIALWRDRIVLAGKPPHIWYMSRSGDPDDWDESVGGIDDVTRPISSTTGEAGIIGRPITALIPASRDYLVMATLSEIWVLRGDPARGGVLENLSDAVGIVGKGAWTRGPFGEIWFLSRDGLYKLDPGLRSFPETISKQKLPRRLIDIADGYNQEYTVNMSYDLEFQGCHIYVTRNEELQGTHSHFWYDSQFDGFWPITLFPGDNPTSIHRYEHEQSSGSSVIHGAASGFLTRYYQNFTTDGGIPFESRVAIGPFVITPDEFRESKLNELIISLAEDSGTVEWELYIGDTAEEAYVNYAAETPLIASGSVTAGLNQSIRENIRAYAFILKLKNENTLPWALERIQAKTVDAGKLRL